MERRTILKSMIAGAGLAISPLSSALSAVKTKSPRREANSGLDDAYLQDYLEKIRNFDKPHHNDLFLDQQNFRVLKSTVERFQRLQLVVGHGNFSLMSFDEALKTARNNLRVGDFSAEEITFLERVFYSTASDYGFLGQKPFNKLTERIPTKEVVKVPQSGNFLYQGEPRSLFLKIRADLGDNVVLTSGIRSVVKQFLLFLDKAYQSNGNLSMASRSLAPPGYSYHGVGDFDVGQADFGHFNFTERFVTTEVFQRLREEGYLTLRYPRDNMLGVRFEPWHIRVGELRV
ncbi:MAG: D-alanyl-D-alanine carboxypeptidase family protein [Magnetococcales bacterium]|nr:D-alanyl-D-alanine carboxypeptidase family protein [Magnetococcales bacterium]